MSSPSNDQPNESATGGVLSAARGFYALCVRKPVALLVLFATLIVIGGISYQRIPLQMMPAGMDQPGLWVEVSHPGSSAAENERKVARVLEEQFRTLQGIERVSSRSSDGEVGFDVTYRSDVDMDICKAELRDRIERARPLMPESVDRIFVWSWSNDQMPIMWLAVTNSIEDERSDSLVDTVVKRNVEAVDGISNMQVWGVLDDSIRILLDEDRIVAANLDIGDLVRRLASDNFAEPLGDVEDGGRKFLLRSDMRFESLEEIENYPVGNGMRLKDVGRVIRA
ncbi:MAG: efflux RND transporter permease subunit, partial [Planctomycetota bacterium]